MTRWWPSLICHRCVSLTLNWALTTPHSVWNATTQMSSPLHSFKPWTGWRCVKCNSRNLDSCSWLYQSLVRDKKHSTKRSRKIKTKLTSIWKGSWRRWSKRIIGGSEKCTCCTSFWTIPVIRHRKMSWTINWRIPFQTSVSSRLTCPSTC